MDIKFILRLKVRMEVIGDAGRAEVKTCLKNNKG